MVLAVDPRIGGQFFFDGHNRWSYASGMRLIKLPNGGWVRTDHIKAISVLDRTPVLMVVLLLDGSSNSRVYESIEEAKADADKLAWQVNEILSKQ